MRFVAALIAVLLVLATLGCSAARVGVYNDEPTPMLATEGVFINDLELNATPVREAIARVSQQTGVTIVYDEPTIEASGIEASAPITAHFRNARLEDVLRTIGEQAGGGVTQLDIDARGTVIRFTTAEAIPAECTVRIYDIGPLVDRALASRLTAGARLDSTQPTDRRDQYLGDLLGGMRNATGIWSETRPELTVVGNTLTFRPRWRDEERAARAFLDAEARRLRVGVREVRVSQ
jgi:hypothetical protein